MAPLYRHIEYDRYAPAGTEWVGGAPVNINSTNYLGYAMGSYLVIPEPVSATLLIVGGVFLTGRRRRMRRKS